MGVFPRIQLSQARDHLALGESLGIIDLQRAAKIAGARFPPHDGRGRRTGSGPC